MASLNSVHIIGRLGQDPTIRYAQNGTPIANLRIATDESYVDREGNKVDRVEWHTVVVYQRAAENCANYLGKGSLVFVEGSLQTRKWQDQQGQDRYSTEIKASRVQFLDRKGDGQGAPRGDQQAQATGPAHTSASVASRTVRMPSAQDDHDLTFPSDASGMDDVPFALLLVPLAGLLATVGGAPWVM